ncbi:hypothetical protein [Streptomyces sp. NPDC014894]|uniref:hypothetical protein n=1 Tax=Streptomyces sp. NPDC014894 TaxID=3364931 RepID=UPI003704A573
MTTALDVTEGDPGTGRLLTLAVTHAPTLVAAAGERAAYRFLEFFTAQIRNPHTRRAYARAVGEFCAWLDTYGLPSITAVSSIHIAEIHVLFWPRSGSFSAALNASQKTRECDPR